MKRTARIFLCLVVGLVTFGIVGSYLGRWFPIGDSFAAFRWELSLLIAVMALFVWRLGLARIALACVAMAMAAGGPILWSMRASNDVGMIRLYQKNIWVWNEAWADVLADIRETDADLVTLQEVHRRHRPLKVALRESHPAWIECGGGVQLYSRLEMIPGTAGCGPDGNLPAAFMQVDGPDGPFWVVSIHLSWPWPYPQAEHAGAIAGLIANLEGPVVFAGDFNMTPWGHAVRQIAAAADARRLGPLRRTHKLDDLPIMRLRIDHVYVPEDWAGRVEGRARLGSDHFGQLAQFSP